MNIVEGNQVAALVGDQRWTRKRATEHGGVEKEGRRLPNARDAFKSEPLGDEREVMTDDSTKSDMT